MRAVEKEGLSVSTAVLLPLEAPQASEIILKRSLDGREKCNITLDWTGNMRDVRLADGAPVCGVAQQPSAFQKVDMLHGAEHRRAANSLHSISSVFRAVEL